MQACHEQAILAREGCLPNPAVGAVFTDSAGEVISVGHTQRRGGPHAEIMALRQAQAHGREVRGSTLYVSLEPCSHFGHTGPCTAELIRAGVKKVVASIADPNPLVSGKGFEQLRAAGIAVEIGPGANASRELNIGFFSRMIRRSPWVRMKVAVSLDGKTALANGKSQWLTSAAARADGHVWRAKAGAILTGIGTILEDNPRLDVRTAGTQRQPALAIVDSRLETPVNSHLFLAQRQVLIYTAVENEKQRSSLQSLGAQVIYMPEQRAESRVKVDLRAVLHDLAVREINELHVEAGHRLNGSLIREGLVDEFLAYLAPKLLGLGLPMASFGPLSELSQAVQLEFISCDVVAPDIRIVARVRGRDKF